MLKKPTIILSMVLMGALSGPGIAGLDVDRFASERLNGLSSPAGSNTATPQFTDADLEKLALSHAIYNQMLSDKEQRMAEASPSEKASIRSEMLTDAVNAIASIGFTPESFFEATKEVKSSEKLIERYEAAADRIRLALDELDQAE